MQQSKNRQIHLDFHTSGLIGGVASEFDPLAFATTLRDAHVSKVCLFTRCHHGYCYYPTKIGVSHPHLERADLLGEQIEALSRVGIDHSLYTTVCWDELTAHSHPEWMSVTHRNQPQKIDPLTGDQVGATDPGWNTLCWNTGYREYFKELIAEPLRLYETESLFIDILVHPDPCCCDACLDRMKRNKLDSTSYSDRLKNSIDSAREFMREVNDVIFRINPRVRPFYNARLRVTGVVDEGSTPEIPLQGEICIESLPSGPWGYDHFPINAKFFQGFEKPIYGMTGKFQKMWGDFGGLKNQAALDFEVLRMVTHGIAASVGDQLHPRAVLDTATYDLIGKTFAKAETIEACLLPSVPVDEIGVLLTNSSTGANNLGSGLVAETGAMKMLMQLHYQYSFIDETFDFSRFKVLVMPDYVRVTPHLRTKIEEYVAAGGSVLASFESGFDAHDKWALPSLDIVLKGDYPSKPYYVYPTEGQLDAEIVEDTEHVFYLGGKEVEVRGEHTVLAAIAPSYFDRSWDHFCSHLQTPPAERGRDPEMVSDGGSLIYFASPIFTCYDTYASRISRTLVDQGLNQLMDGKLVTSTLPTTAETTLRRNEDGETVFSVLHYIPQRRGANVDTIEDVIPLYGVDARLNLGEAVSEVRDASTGEQLEFSQEGGSVSFRLERIDGFRVVVLK